MTDFNTKDNHLKISQINSKIQEAITSRLGSFRFWVQGEISGLNIVGGHCYLNLIEKESSAASPKASIRGMIWSKDYLVINKKFSNATGFDLKDNIKILFLARVNYHVLHGLNLTIEDIEPGYTLGAMLMERDAIVKRLKHEGHYFLNKSKSFPIVPQRIAVISAKDSKGYEDFLTKIQNNAYGYKYTITLFPSLLQGDKAAENMQRQLINIFRSIQDFDIVVIVRGGGGSVNLNCFNDYLLSKTVARFPIPVITGIGHTSNISIVDEVAYSDKITPTDVAGFIIETTNIYERRIMEKFERIIRRYNEVRTFCLNLINQKSKGLIYAVDKIKIAKTNDQNYQFNEINKYAISLLKKKNQDLVYSQKIFAGIVNTNINKKKSELYNKLYSINSIFSFQIRNLKGDLRSAATNLNLNYKNFVRAQKLVQKNIADKIEILDPKNILKRGYSITMKNGKAVTKAKLLSPNDLITTILFDGEIKSKIIK